MKTRKILALLLVLVMMAGLLSTSAFATTYATGIAVYVYKGANDHTVYELGNLTSGDTALDAFIQADSTSAATYYTATGGSWLYTINGNLASYSAADYTVQNNDFLAFYLVPDYTVDTLIAPSYYTEWLINGVIQSVTTNHTLGNDLGMETGLNYAHPTVNYISASSAYQAKTANSPLTAIDGFLFISGSATGHNVLTTCYPVKLRSIDSAWIEVMRAQAIQLKAITDNISATEIGQATKTTLDGKAATAVGAPTSPPIMMGTFLDFEDAFAALSYDYDARLDYVAFTGDIAVTEPFYPYFTSYIVQSASVDPTAVPNSFTMTVTPKDSTAAVSVTGSTGVSISGTDDTRLVTLPYDTTSMITVAITKTVVPDDPDEPGDTGVYVIKTYTFTITTPPAPTNNASLYAYLPAPGQFTNEGVTTGGWGDAYTSNGTPKINTATGMSLGFYGGYAVYKFDYPVSNNVLNPFGADFIVYGNAFWKNSEPGCIQVAEGANGAPADVNGDGVIWYDIAGSQYYTDNTEYASIIYTNPDATEDAGISSPGNNLGTRAAVSYSLNGASSASVAVNPFHNHSWWPLFANYFKTVTGRAEMAKISEFPFITSNPASPSQSSVSSTLTFTGMRLKSVNTTLSENFKFGYADVHGNYQLGGNVAYNPYAIGVANITTSAGYNTWLEDASYTEGQASGGDPIDISWAVYPAYYDDGIHTGAHPKAGQPVYEIDPLTGLNSFTSIQFVRVYTGAAMNNGINGELSTEVCGIATVSGTGDGAADSDLYVVKNNADDVYVDAIGDEVEQIPATPNMSTIPVTYSSGMVIDVFSDADYVYVNGALASCTSANAYQFAPTSGGTYQIITQSGTESPYIVVLKVS